ncbi:hypothetical protein TRFO_15622 [Tritrichomonas foetus]|uniref:Uncharacterized protein n=1 Tax=Tritrichomonas foetus TaxID=1144522 RepID=A0A1J4KT79_9EUKA|nr:hypothetical protein TRFO_15622 [Tritrichomonas foetus]|eukprot:OHT14088.1 hypothetical protein TRFO_15622 [Tritrichomonas foetus]
MGLADFMNMMNQAQTQSDDTDDVSDNNSNNNSIPPQSPVAQQNDFYNHPPPPSPIQPVTTPQATTSPSPIQPVATPQAAAGTSPAQHSQLKSNPLPKPKSSPPQQQPQQAYPTTGSTAHDIMAAAQNDPGKGKRGKKGVARFMKRPSNDAVFDQMLKMSENSCRPESAPIIQAPPQ